MLPSSQSVNHIDASWTSSFLKELPVNSENFSLKFSSSSFVIHVNLSFSNSLIIHQIKTGNFDGVEIYLIDFYDFISVFFLVLVSIEKIYLTLKTVFDHISKYLEVHQKYSAMCCIFNPLLGAFKDVVKHSLSCLIYYTLNHLCFFMVYFFGNLLHK